MFGVKAITRTLVVGVVTLGATTGAAARTQNFGARASAVLQPAAGGRIEPRNKSNAHNHSSAMLLGTVSTGRAPLGPILNDGTLLRNTGVGKSPSALAIDSQTARVFVLNRDSQAVSVLDGGNGQLLRNTGVGKSPSALAIDSQTARVFVLNQDSQAVSVLDAHSGTLLRNTGVGKSPSALAIDSQTARVFVLNRDSQAVSVLDANA